MDNWILCSDRLPEDLTDVLVSFEGRVKVACYCSEHKYPWCFLVDRFSAKGVDAWMPLPEPYSEP